MPMLSAATDASRVPHQRGTYYTPQQGDVIWAPEDAAVAWGVSRDTVVRYCAEGRCRHLKLSRDLIILQADRPAPVVPGTLSPELRAAARHNKSAVRK